MLDPHLYGSIPYIPGTRHEHLPGTVSGNDGWLAAHGVADALVRWLRKSTIMAFFPPRVTP
ncbi:MAG: hypothetical protein KGJ32_05435 [Xanthomonadaceae bacterium]|nr:hypothetical protein [Xanthomonadaceae bacterium]